MDVTTKLLPFINHEALKATNLFPTINRHHHWYSLTALHFWGCFNNRDEWSLTIRRLIKLQIGSDKERMSFSYHTQF